MASASAFLGEAPKESVKEFLREKRTPSSTAAAAAPDLSPAEVARRLGIPGAEKLTDETVTPRIPEDQLDKPLVTLPQSAKDFLGKAAVKMVAGPFSSLLPSRVSSEVGESLGGLIESSTSPAGIAAIPAAAIAPAVVLPEMIKGGFDAGVQQIREGKPFAGATTIAVAASPAAAFPLKAAMKGKSAGLSEAARAVEEVRQEPQPPPLPETVTKKPVTAKEPAATTESLPPKSTTPTAETSLWQKLLSKHFEFEKPKEVFASTAPVEAATLDALTTAIKESKPARRETEALRTVERSRRAATQAEIQSGSPGRAGVGQLKGALAGELPRIDLEPFAEKLSPVQQDSLYNHIYGHELLKEDVYRRSNLAIALQNLMENGHLPQPNQVAWFERIFGPQVAQAMLGKQRVASRSLRTLSELANIPRTMITGFDITATGRQGFSLGVAHPEIASRAMEAQLKAFASRDYALSVDRTFRSGEQARIREKAGLELPSIEGLADSVREEHFTSRLIQNLQNIKPKSDLAKLLYNPIYAYSRGLAGSERAYVTYLNWLRTNVFDSIDAVFKDSGLPEDIIDLKRHQTAMLINSATGRGNVSSNALLNAFFFSPRFTASRFEYPFRLAKSAATDRTKLGIEARRQLAAHAAAWTSMFTLMHLASEHFDWDVKFGYDPRSADFLKVRIGDATVDAGAGYGQAIRLMARFLTGETVNMKTGREQKADRAKELGNFTRYKLAPVPGEAWSIAEGKTPDGKKISVPGVVADLTVPITLQNTKDIWDEFGAAGLPLMIPDALGFGVNVTGQETKKSERE